MEARAAGWSLQHRNKDWARAAAALEAQAQGQAEEPKPEEEGSDEPASFILRSLYLPEQGMFRQMDADLQLGQRLKVGSHSTVWATRQW